MGMRLRIRDREASFVVTLPDDASLQILFDEIFKHKNSREWKCNLLICAILFWILVFGKFPPVELSKSQANIKLADLGIANAETLTLETRSPPAEPIPPQVILKEIPDDNSCLFNAIGYVLEDHSRSKAQYLRNLVAEYILSRPLEFSEAVLGRKPSDYAAWITKMDAWGGAIELSIFSSIYSVEIASFDVQSGRMDLFGEGRGYENRVYLQYTGIHYEAFALALDPSLSESAEVTIFAASDVGILQQVKQLVAVARASHRFTDLAGFTLRCEICKSGLKGQSEAQRHAMQTGHASFVEYT